MALRIYSGSNQIGQSCWTIANTMEPTSMGKPSNERVHRKKKQKQHSPRVAWILYFPRNVSTKIVRICFEQNACFIRRKCVSTILQM